MKSVGENEAKKICFVLTLYPTAKVSVSGIKWYRPMVPTSVAAITKLGSYVLSNDFVSKGTSKRKKAKGK